MGGREVADGRCAHYRDNCRQPNRLQELGLEDSEELSIYLELIRIIEKDIDEIKAVDTRSGWTSWAMLGGIALGMSLLPEEFPLVMTVFMAMGAWRISQARVLTRRYTGSERARTSPDQTTPPPGPPPGVDTG